MFSVVRTFVNRSSQLKIFKGMASWFSRASSNEFFVFIDMEMTGLDPSRHKIVEIACIVTNPMLKELHDGIHIITHQPQYIFDNECNEWSKIQHSKSGLMDLSIKSSISTQEADVQVANYIKEITEYNIGEKTCYLAGSSVYMDKRFLEIHMPNINTLLSYKLIDVTSVKLLCKHWYPLRFKEIPPKVTEHRAYSDIKASIEELKTLRDYFFHVGIY